MFRVQPLRSTRLTGEAKANGQKRGKKGRRRGGFGGKEGRENSARRGAGTTPNYYLGRNLLIGKRQKLI